MALSDNQRTALTVMQFGYPALWASVANGHRHDTITEAREASRIIGAVLKAVAQAEGGIWPWKYWTKQSVCAQALYESTGNIEAAVGALTPNLGKIKALTFGRNRNGKWTPYDLNDRVQKNYAVDGLRATLVAVRDDVAKALNGNGQKIEPEEKPEERQEKPEEKKPEKKEQKRHPWLCFIDRTEQFCAARAADGHPLDEWGMRQAEYGAMMLKAEIPMEALKHAATLHFPPEARRALEVTEYDPTTFRPERRESGFHAVLPYVETLVNAGVPTALVGPKGTGKTTLARQIAERMGLRFSMISMTSATSPSAFFGRPQIADPGVAAMVEALIAANRIDEAMDIAKARMESGGVIESEFSQIMRTGGLILLDEMDAADENLLLIANSAIANRVFYNQVTTELIDVDPSVVFMAGMNTLGLGATRDYKARNGQDAAVMDRWTMGRVMVKKDKKLEETIFCGIMNG